MARYNEPLREYQFGNIPNFSIVLTWIATRLAVEAQLARPFILR